MTCKHGVGPQWLVALLKWSLTPILVWAGVALGQESRVLELAGGARIEYTLHTFPENAHRAETLLQHPPGGTLDTAKLVTQLLAEGRLEDVALLSNAPKARYERLKDSFGNWQKEDFERAFRRYFAPENRILGEAAIGAHRLLMWYLKDTNYITAYYFVELEGRLLLDDVPSETRNRLRRVLEDFRARR